jgi:type II secretory pathway component PulF
MPFYKFEALDKLGTTVTGTVEARSPVELVNLLQSKQLKPVSVDGIPVGAQANAGSFGAVARPVLNPAATATTQTERRTIPGNVPAAQVVPAANYPKPGWFSPVIKPMVMAAKFDQMYSLFKTGLESSSVFGHLAAQQLGDLSVAFADLKVRTSKGESIANAMRHHPSLFTPDISGTLEVGEIAGQVPSAVQQVVTTLRRARYTEYARWLFVAYVLIWVVLLPIAVALGNATYETSKVVLNSTTAVSGIEVLKGEFLKALPMALLKSYGFFAVLWFLFWLFRRAPMRTIRHGWGLYTPVLGQRQQAEATERVAWALEHLTSAGQTPQTSIKLAAQCIPNDVLRNRMVSIALKATPETPMHELLKRLGIFSLTEVHMIESGQIAGDLVTPLQTIARDRLDGHRKLTTVSSILLYIVLSALVVLPVASIYMGIVQNVMVRPFKDTLDEVENL